MKGNNSKVTRCVFTNANVLRGQQTRGRLPVQRQDRPVCLSYVKRDARTTTESSNRLPVVHVTQNVGPGQRQTCAPCEKNVCQTSTGAIYERVYEYVGVNTVASENNNAASFVVKYVSTIRHEWTSRKARISSSNYEYLFYMNTYFSLMRDRGKT